MAQNIKKRWGEVAKEVDQLNDSLGHPIDAGIKDAVIALRCLGINTVMSCKGHDNRGIAAPWIDIASQVSEQIMRRRITALKQGKQKLAAKLLKKIERLNFKESTRLFSYLKSFYRYRNVPFEQRLTLQDGWMGNVRLISQGGLFQKVLAPTQRKKKLRSYQNEMHQFVKFLKKKILK